MRYILSFVLTSVLAVNCVAAEPTATPTATKIDAAAFASPVIKNTPVNLKREPRYGSNGPGKLFWTFAAASVALTVADVELTHSCVNNVAGCRERNPLFGPHPTRARMYSISLPITSALLGVSYYVRRKNKANWAWKVPPISLTASHAAGVVSNLAAR